MAVIPSVIQYILIVCFVHGIGILYLFILYHYLAPPCLLLSTVNH